MEDSSSRCAQIISLIGPKLKALPSKDERGAREDSWMSTEQIRQRLAADGLHFSAQEVEACLQGHESGSEHVIRSAKYPHTFMLDRLWGHVARVGPGEPEPALKTRSDTPRSLEGIQQFVGRPTVFLSYAKQDSDLAFEIARNLSSLQITPWLYELNINRDDLIFEAVKAALRRADVLMALITPFSIASLWVRTETTSSTVFGVPVTLAIPDTWPDLITLLTEATSTEEGWRRVAELLQRLERSYVSAGSQPRVEKYQARVEGFLPFLLNYARSRPVVALGTGTTELTSVLPTVTLEQFASDLSRAHRVDPH